MDDPFPQGMLENIEKFFKNDSSRLRGEDIYPEVFLTELFFPLQRQLELKEMVKVARRFSPKVVYEIGSDKGGGLYHWCKCLPTVTRVIACEIRGTPYRHLFEKAFPDIDFLWIEESSYSEESLQKIATWLGKDSLDVVFIDGDKTAFETDFDCILPHMAKHSVVFMHDITDFAPGTAYNRVIGKRSMKHEAIVNKQDTWDALNRELNGVPSTGSHEGWLRHWKGASCGVGIIRVEK